MTRALSPPSRRLPTAGRALPPPAASGRAASGRAARGCKAATRGSESGAGPLAVWRRVSRGRRGAARRAGRAQRRGLRKWLRSSSKADAAEGPPDAGVLHQKRGHATASFLGHPSPDLCPLGGSPAGPAEPSWGPLPAPAPGPAPCRTARVASVERGLPLGGTALSPEPEQTGSAAAAALPLASAGRKCWFPSRRAVETPADPQIRPCSPAPAGPQTWAGGSLSPPRAPRIRRDAPGMSPRARHSQAFEPLSCSQLETQRQERGRPGGRGCWAVQPGLCCGLRLASPPSGLCHRRRRRPPLGHWAVGSGGG